MCKGHPYVAIRARFMTLNIRYTGILTVEGTKDSLYEMSSSTTRSLDEQQDD